MTTTTSHTRREHKAKAYPDDTAKDGSKRRSQRSKKWGRTRPPLRIVKRRDARDVPLGATAELGCGLVATYFGWRSGDEA